MVDNTTHSQEEEGVVRCGQRLSLNTALNLLTSEWYGFCDWPTKIGLNQSQNTTQVLHTALSVARQYIISLYHR